MEGGSEITSQSHVERRPSGRGVSGNKGTGTQHSYLWVENSASWVELEGPSSVRHEMRLGE